MNDNYYIAVRKDSVTDTVTEDIRRMPGSAVAGLFAGFIHIYDFNKAKEVNCHREVAKMILHTVDR